MNKGRMMTAAGVIGLSLTFGLSSAAAPSDEEPLKEFFVADGVVRQTVDVRTTCSYFLYTGIRSGAFTVEAPVAPEAPGAAELRGRATISETVAPGVHKAYFFCGRGRLVTEFTVHPKQ